MPASVTESEIEALKGLRREIALVRRKLTAHSSERETESEDDEEKTNINGNMFNVHHH